MELSKQRNELIPRIDAAIERITSGNAATRIPADPTDPDVVLCDVRRFLLSLAVPSPAPVAEAPAPTWWCCSADYPNHDSGCANAAAAQAGEGVLTDDEYWQRRAHEPRVSLDTKDWCLCGLPVTHKVHTTSDAEPLEAELAEAQRLYERTTDGEWLAKFAQYIPVPPMRTVAGREFGTLDTEPLRNNAAWIAAAHNLWPKLIAAARRDDAD